MAPKHTLDVAWRMSQVEANLGPAIQIRGKAEVRWPLAERMTKYAVPGVNVAVVQGGSVEWAQGYGLLEAGRDARVSPETRFQAASISKPVSCLGALRLVEQGMLSLDTPVNDQLRTWQLPENDLSRDRPVTLRGLMSHTAGLGVHGFPGYRFGQPLPTLQQILDGQPPANTPPVRVEIRPGERFEYSGGGTCVMQMLMTDVTGTPFPQLMQELVLGPLEMTHSTYELLPEGFGADTVARGHLPDGEPIPGGWHNYPESAPAGLWTTPSDLCRFAIALQDAYAGTLDSALTPATVRSMLRPVMAKPGGFTALGPVITVQDGVTYFGHGGDNAGYHCGLLAGRDTGQAVAVMTNGDGGMFLQMEVTASVARAYGWSGVLEVRDAAAVSPALLAGLAGTYEIQPGFGVTISVTGDHLSAEFPGMGAVDLYASSETEFFATLLERITVTFETAANGDRLMRIPVMGVTGRRVR